MRLNEELVVSTTDMGFRLCDHTADIAVEATGDTFATAAAAAADGMAAAMCDTIPSTGNRFSVSVTAESRSAVLFEYLDELILQRDIRGVLPVENTATVTSCDSQWQLTGSARGVPLADVHAREIKAVTYSEMDIKQTAAGWRVYVVFDV